MIYSCAESTDRGSRLASAGRSYSGKGDEMTVIFEGTDSEFWVDETYNVGDLVPVRGGSGEVVRTSGDKAYIKFVEDYDSTQYVFISKERLAKKRGQ